MISVFNVMMDRDGELKIIFPVMSVQALPEHKKKTFKEIAEILLRDFHEVFKEIGKNYITLAEAEKNNSETVLMTFPEMMKNMEKLLLRKDKGDEI